MASEHGEWIKAEERYEDGCRSDASPHTMTPDRSAPEDLVEALAGAVCECGHTVYAHDDDSAGCWSCDCNLPWNVALAPTVARLVREAEERAGERLAGVADGDCPCGRPLRHHVGCRERGFTVAELLRAALAGSTEGQEVPSAASTGARSAEQALEAVRATYEAAGLTGPEIGIGTFRGVYKGLPDATKDAIRREHGMDA